MSRRRGRRRRRRRRRRRVERDMKLHMSRCGRQGEKRGSEKKEYRGRRSRGR